MGPRLKWGRKRKEVGPGWNNARGSRQNEAVEWKNATDGSGCRKAN